jgi:hypothetical protein
MLIEDVLCDALLFGFAKSRGLMPTAQAASAQH